MFSHLNSRENLKSFRVHLTLYKVVSLNNAFMSYVLIRKNVIKMKPNLLTDAISQVDVLIDMQEETSR